MGVIGAAVSLILGDFFAALIAALPGTSVVGVSITLILIVFFAIALLLGILYIVFGAKTIKACKLDAAGYKDKQGMFLGFAITETILTGLSIYSLITSITNPSSQDSLISSIVIFAIMAIIIIFRWVGFGLVCKMLKVEAIKMSTPSLPEPTNQDNFDKLEKLAKLKEMGAITEEEFNEKKSQLLK